jgi:hypothetical protein
MAAVIWGRGSVKLMGSPAAAHSDASFYAE